MNSRNHAIQAVILALLILAVSPPPSHPFVLVGFVLIVGVGIDFDHFLIARINTGSWKNLRRVVRHPEIVVLDQTAIFDTLDVWAEDRLFTHLLLAGIGVGLLWMLDLPYWAGVTAVTLYTHVMADVLNDMRRKEQRTVEISNEIRVE